MNNQTSSWSEQLQRIGLSEFTDANREILTDIEASGVPLNTASIFKLLLKLSSGPFLL